MEGIGVSGNRVLAAASPRGLKLEMIREPDGWFAIMLDGKAESRYRWPADHLEQCVDMYLSLLRHRPLPDKPSDEARMAFGAWRKEDSSQSQSLPLGLAEC